MKKVSMRRFLVGLVVILLGIGILTIQTTSAHADTLTAAPDCPSNWTCISMPNNGGTLQVGPTQGVAPLGGVQPFVYIKGYGFHPGDVLREHFCSFAPATMLYCVVSAGSAFLGNPSATLSVMSDGTFSYTTQVPVNPPENETPFDGQIPSTGTSGPFYCSGKSDLPCGIVITDGNLANPYTNTPNSQNSAEVPISYNLTPPDCPGAQTLVTTESDQMMAPLLTSVDRAACASSQPFVLFNTESTGGAAVHDLYQSVRSTSSTAVRIAFTTDPEVASQQAELPAGHFVLIPVGLTSVVTAFSSQIGASSKSFLQPEQNLTANMNAGIFTGLYTDAGPQTDAIDCSGTCSTPPCLDTSSCSLLQLVTSHPGYYMGKTFAAQPLAVQTGATQALTSWMCNAPQDSVPWGTTSSAEAGTAADVMLAGLAQGGHTMSSCPTTEMWPAESISSSKWTAGSNPFDQLKAMIGVLPQVGAGYGSSVADFAYMYEPWAHYLGLQIAGELNASNTFQLPTAESIYAALNDATLNPDGTLTPTYNNTSDTQAYPMPAVIYAAVSTDTMSADQKANIQGALTNILKVTGPSSQQSGGGVQGANIKGAAVSSATLPDGYYPLTSDLYKQATAEVAQAVGNPSFQISSVLPQLASKGGSSSGYSSPSFNAGSYGVNGQLAAHAADGKGSQRQQVPSSSPLYGAIFMSNSASRLLIPGTIAAGAIALLIGVMIMSWGAITYATKSVFSRRVSADDPEADAGSGGEE
jgi:hypothetical protein